MLIRELLAEKAVKGVKIIGPGDTIGEAAQRLMAHNIGALIVVSESAKLAGIVSERDLIRAITEYGGGLVDEPVSEIMTRSVHTCVPGDNVADVLHLMKRKGIRHIPVLKGEQLDGIISMRELTRAYELLQEEANTDALTGLPNRRQFYRTLNNEFDRYRRYGRPLSVAMMGVDSFKLVNDSYGHDAGDKLLRTLADLLVFELRTSDWIGRLGGEEFAIIFPETNFGGTKLACERLLQKIREAKLDLDGTTIGFTVSIGLATANSDSNDPDALMKTADKLMYKAKAAGKNNIQVEFQRERHDYQLNQKESVVSLTGTNVG